MKGFRDKGGNAPKGLVAVLFLSFALLTPAFAQGPGHRVLITKEELVETLKAGRWVEGRVIKGAHIAAIVKNTDLDIRIRGSVIKGGLDLSHLAQAPLETRLAPDDWNKKERKIFIRARQSYLKKVRVVTNKIMIVDSEVENGIGKGKKISTEAARTFFHKKVSFKGSHFKGKVNFPDATFARAVSFERARFDGRTNFSGVFFAKDADFSNITMDREPYFSGIHFNRKVSFKGATFKKRTGFSGTTFRKDADFSGATFLSNVGFLGSTFKGAALFTGVTFRQWTYLAGIVFHGTTDFTDATFHKMVHFSGTEFRGRTDFTDTVFMGFTFFPGARFLSAPDFSATTFSNPPVLSGARFFGPHPPRLPASTVR